ncbi:MAG: methylmalonyl-CoA epimerase [Chloroflexi bacterium]|nr:methylmalonyl-CoA epimerase [Chloroflexota bacterium]
MKINHIAIVVEDVNAALTFWRDALGLPLQHTERNDGEAVEIAFLPMEGHQGEIELIAPITPDSGVAKYLAKKGAGLHHICLEVPDVAAKLEELKSKGIELINDSAKTRPDGTLYAFVHPKSTGGVLLELYQLPKSG